MVTLSPNKSNPIKVWFDLNTKIKKDHNRKDKKYSRGMFISISNNEMFYGSIYKNFKDQYISIIKAIKGKDYNISKWNIRSTTGDFNKDQIKVPTRETLLKLCANQTPIMICGVHNYKSNDPRNKGKEYTHSHFYLYNIHHHLPEDPVELRSIEGKIEAYLQRYCNTPAKKRVQGLVRIKEVGVGEYQFIDNVTPVKLYDYLTTPITNQHQQNIINYISNNRHMPSIQYPLTTIYLNKKL